MELEDKLNELEEMSGRYASLGAECSDLIVLQNLLTDVTILHGELGNFVSSYKKARVMNDHMRPVKLACIKVEITEKDMADKKDSGAKLLSDRKIEELARCSPEYSEFLDVMSTSISDWDVLAHKIQSTILLKHTIASHIGMLKGEKI